MKELDFSFEPLPWEALTASAREQISAAALLSVTEEASEEEFEEILEDLRTRRVMPQLSDLPDSGAVGEAALRLRREQQWAQSGMQVNNLDESDPLRLYLEELAAVPAFGDVTILSAQRDEASRAALVNLSLSRVVELALEYTGLNVLLLDLIQEGNLGLWQAVQEFSAGEFEPHRDWYIRFYMASAVLRQARENGVGQKLRTSLEDYSSVRDQLLGELGRNPTAQEIADKMHVTAETAAMLDKLDSDARRLMQIKQPRDEEQEKADEDQAVEDTAYFQMRQRITDLLSILDADDAKLLTLRFGLENGLPKSPEETGKIMGLTPDEVLAREAAALAKLRNDR